jgi:hypothetical protein
MRRWNYVRCASTSDALESYLDAGWEPFAVTSEEWQGAAGPFLQSVVHLRIEL